MVNNCKRTPEVNSKRKALRKFGKFNIKTDQINGTVEISNYREYPWEEEVDIVFTGEIRVRTHFGDVWVGSKEANYNNGGISKVKVNKFIRRTCINDISSLMRYFGVNIPYAFHIKKVIWK